jgi:acetyl-CoA C-acetyltransferase
LPNALWALSIPVPFTKPVGAGAGGYFAPYVRSYIRRSGAPNHIGAMVAVKDRLNGAKTDSLKRFPETYIQSGWQD